MSDLENSTRADLRPLSKWILSPELPLRLRERSFPDGRAVGLCQSLGILRERGFAETVVCRECPDPHDAAVIFNADRIFYRCLLNGDVELAKEDVQLFGLDRGRLLEVLSGAARCPATARAAYAGGNLVKLGLVEDQEIAWVLAYADGLDDINTLSGVIDCIAKLLPDGPGLIATPSSVPLNLPLPRQYKFIQLHELFFGEADRIVLDRSAARHRLGRRKMVPGTPGRPTEIETTRRLQAELIALREWPESRHEQADSILRRWPQAELFRPSPRTIRNHLRALERREGGGDQSLTTPVPKSRNS